MSPLIFYNFKQMDCFCSVNVQFTVVFKFSVHVGIWTLFRNCAVAESAYGTSLTMHAR